MSLGIRGKLVAIFILIKVIPLALLGGVTWDTIKTFGQTATEQTKAITKEMHSTVVEVGKLAVADSVAALDNKAREAIERLTTDTARDVARFLYERDSEIRFASSLTPDQETYQHFLESRTRPVSVHGKWALNENQSAWVSAEDTLPHGPKRQAKVEENKTQFNYRFPESHMLGQKMPVYAEMTFIDLEGNEQVKVTTHEMMDKAKKNVSLKQNTFIQAESYFDRLKSLKPGEIYVSDVIGAYRPSPIIGPYTPANAEKAGIPFEPENSAYAGKENPVGKRFEGIVRWATPVVKDGKVNGYVTLALNHRHIMEFSDHIVPTEERYSDISDAASGNYAFMWDYKGRNISHPRDFFIAGYDPETGEPSVPWLAEDIYQKWQESSESYANFEKTAPQFLKPGQGSKPSIELKRMGQVALDCRYLNFAPQCAGWWNLTEEGGSGSFMIFWSGLWKLTTAAAIPYYTGQYAHSKRGFGFVTIGANVDEFHRAATETKTSLDKIIDQQEQKALKQEEELLHHINATIKRAATELSTYTGLMIVLVILIAFWMANVLSGRIMELIKSLRKIESGDFSTRVKVTSHDEMGELATSLNTMSDSLQKLITENKAAVHKAETSDRAKSDFLANMSHELRTPLNAILGFSDLLRSLHADKIRPEQSQSYAHDIHQSGQHLLSLINEILDVARIGSGEVDLDEEAIDIDEAFHQSLRMVELKAQEKRIKIAYSASNLPKIYADNRRIKQIFLNVLSNAVKFTPTEGEIINTIKILENGDMEIRVRDNGIGMDEDGIELALTPFAQVESSLTRSHEGTGLGLPMAKMLVDLHQGTLELKSSPGNGTEVIITLPQKRIQMAN